MIFVPLNLENVPIGRDACLSGGSAPSLHLSISPNRRQSRCQFISTSFKERLVRLHSRSDPLQSDSIDLKLKRAAIHQATDTQTDTEARTSGGGQLVHSRQLKCGDLPAALSLPVLKTAAIIEFSQSFLCAGLSFFLLAIAACLCFLFGAVVYLMKGMLSRERQSSWPRIKSCSVGPAGRQLAGKKFRFFIWLQRSQGQNVPKGKNGHSVPFLGSARHDRRATK